MSEEKPKRTWHYIQRPAIFEIAPCDCGNADAEWSEFEKHLWCGRCQKDFIPTHNGIFDGPIPIGAAKLLGICFNRHNMVTKKVERFDTETGQYLKPTAL